MRLLALVILFACAVGPSVAAQDSAEILGHLDAQQAALSAQQLPPLPEVRSVAASLHSVDEILEFVQTEIRYQAYTGRLHGSRGTLLGRAGNDVDKSELLAALLRERGHNCRYARGQISPEQIETLLAGMGRATAMAEDRAFGEDPAYREWRATLAEQTADHWWVQIQEGEQWRDLDPVMPGLAPGTAACPALVTYEQLPDEMTHRALLEVEFRVLRGDIEVDVSALSRELTIGDLYGEQLVLENRIQGRPENDGFVMEAFQPVLFVGAEPFPGLVITPEGERQEAAEAAAPAASRLGSVFDLLDETEEQTAAALPPKLAVLSQWVKVTFSGPGEAPEPFTYTVFSADDEGHKASGLYGLGTTVAFGFSAAPHTRAAVDHEVGTLGPAVAEFAARARDIVARIPGQPPAPEQREQFGTAQIEAQRVLAWLLNEKFLLTSDEVLARIESETGIAAYHAQPRAVITAISYRPEKMVYSMDLRHNEVALLVSQDRPESWSRHLQLFRGLHEARLEGAILKLVSDQPGITVGEVLQQAAQQNIPRRWVTPDNREPLESNVLGTAALAQVEQALDRGRWVLLPERPVPVGGHPCIAWFEVDPRTGFLDGVFANGRHQGYAEDVALNYLLGCIVGSAGSYYSTMEVGFVFGMAAGLSHFLDCILADPTQDCMGRKDVCDPAILDALALCDDYWKLTGAAGLNPLPFLGVPDLWNLMNGDACQIGAAFGLRWFGCGS